MQQEIWLNTSGRGFFDLTTQVQAVLEKSGLQSGLCHCFIRHTSASLIITENADPAVHADLENWMLRWIQDGDSRYTHRAEGPDDMPAHIRSMLSGCSQSIPFIDGRLALGTWQSLYLWEHRSAPHRRCVLLTLSQGI